MVFTGVWLLVYTVVLHVSAVDLHRDCCSLACLLPSDSLRVITLTDAGKRLKVEPGDKRMETQKPATWSTSHSSDRGDGSCSVFGCVYGRFERSPCQSAWGERYWSRVYVLRCEGGHCVLLLDPVVAMPQEPSTSGFLEWSTSTFEAGRTSGKIGNHCCTQLKGGPDMLFLCRNTYCHVFFSSDFTLYVRRHHSCILCTC